VNTFSSMGAYYSRPYGHLVQAPAQQDAQSAVTLKKLKEMFDPNNVMNPRQALRLATEMEIER